MCGITPLDIGSLQSAQNKQILLFEWSNITANDRIIVQGLQPQKTASQKQALCFCFGTSVLLFASCDQSLFKCICLTDCLGS